MTTLSHISIGGDRYEILRYYITPFNKLRVEVRIPGKTYLPFVDFVRIEGEDINEERKVVLPMLVVHDKESLISVIEIQGRDPESLEFPKQDFPNNYKPAPPLRVS